MRPVVVLVGLLVLALNLRAALAAYPPLLETAREDLGLSSGAAGLVQSGAVLMMAVASFAGASIGERFGRERTLGAAVGLVAVGSLVRAWSAVVPLIAGSLVLGFGIGLAGVLITGVVKEHLGKRAGAATGGYTFAMMIGATVASALAVPLAVWLGGWSFSLAVWAVPAALSVALWTPITRRIGQGRDDSLVAKPGADVTAGPWRNRFALLVALFQAGTSLAFYGWLTWLAPYYEHVGWSPEGAGVLLALWSVAQIPAALLMPALAERRRRWRFWAGLGLAFGVAGTLGVLLLPDPPVIGPWLWVLLIAIGMGAGFPLGLTVIAWRTPHGAASAATSGFALGVGYLSAGLGPLLMGVLVDVTKGYAAAIGVLLVAAAVQAVAIVLIGDEPAC